MPVIKTLHRNVLVFISLITGCLGLLYYYASFNEEHSNRLGEFFGFAPDVHLMRNSGILFLIVSLCNAVAIFSKEKVFLWCVILINCLVIGHEIVETFVFGGVNYLAGSIILIMFILCNIISIQDVIHNRSIQSLNDITVKKID